jgi:hypothetical protein
MMKKLFALLAVVMMLFVFSSASAMDNTGKWAAGGYLGYSFGFGDAFKEHQFGYPIPGSGFSSYSFQNKLGFCLGAQVKYGLKPKMDLVGNLDYQAGSVDVKGGAGGYSYDAGDSYDFTAILGNVLYTFSPEKKTTPNVTGGVGLYMDGDTNLGINLGGGIEHLLKKNLTLDAGARFHMIFSEGDKTTYLQIRAGVMYYFGVK